MNLSISTLREVKRMIMILNNKGPAYWLAWGSLVVVYLFGLSALIKAVRWW